MERHNDHEAKRHFPTNNYHHRPIHKSKVLILEDFDEIRALLSQHFVRQGYEVYSSATLDGALSMSKDRAPDVLFIDYDLASENPFDATRQLHAALPQSRIVLMGGPGTEDEHQRAIHAGASSIMDKAYDLTGMDNLISHTTIH